jgi:hypothetical protein
MVLEDICRRPAWTGLAPVWPAVCRAVVSLALFVCGPHLFTPC